MNAPSQWQRLRQVQELVRKKSNLAKLGLRIEGYIVKVGHLGAAFAVVLASAEPWQ